MNKELEHLGFFREKKKGYFLNSICDLELLYKLFGILRIEINFNG